MVLKMATAAPFQFAFDNFNPTPPQVMYPRGPYSAYPYIPPATLGNPRFTAGMNGIVDSLMAQRALGQGAPPAMLMPGSPLSAARFVAGPGGVVDAVPGFIGPASSPVRPYTQGLMANPLAEANAVRALATGTTPALENFALSPWYTASTRGRAGIGLKGLAGAKGLGWGLAGWGVSKGVQEALPGSTTTEHVLSGAAQGAGAGIPIGAAIGAAGGPIGAVAGGLIGAGLGGLGGLIFGGKGKKKESSVINLSQLYQAANVDPETQEQFKRYYKTLVAVDGSKESRLRARQTIAQLVQQYALTQQANPVHELTPAEAAAMQAQTAAYLKPYHDQTLATAQSAYDTTMANLSKLPANIQAIYKSNASNQLSAATRLANAYAAQAQLAPQTYALQQQQQTQQAIARQLMQQQYQQAMYPPQQAQGGVDFATLGQGG